MKWLVVILLFSFISCGGDWGPRHIDPEIAGRVADFEARTGHEVISSVFMADMPTGTILEPSRQGLCVADEGERPAIYLSNALDGYALDAILWHEIGHCDLGLGHTAPDDITAFIVEGLPLPIMLAPASIMAADLSVIPLALENGYADFYLCSLGVCE